MAWFRLCLVVAILFPALTSGQTPVIEEGSELRVRLLAPLNTKLNRKGDMVSAKVVEPAKLQGGILEGEIHDIAKSSVQFQFHTLHLSGAALPVSAGLKGIANSKRQAGVDEGGTQVETSQKTEAPAHSSGFPLFRRGDHREKEPPPHSGGAIRLSTKDLGLALAPGSELVLQIEAKEP